MDIKKRLGWHPGLPHHSKVRFLPKIQGFQLPTVVNLEDQCPPVYDQGNLGSCTANAAAGLSQFLQKKLYRSNFTPSRLALYYWTRLREGTQGSDSGASLSDAVTVLETYGSPHESWDKYDISRFTQEPSARVVSDAAKHVITNAQSVTQDLYTTKNVLAGGHPFIFGFTVYESFESQALVADGIMPLPLEGEKVLGGHAVMAVGYDDSLQRFRVRNSWGTGWGQKGYFTMPYAFLTDPQYASDMWTAVSFSVFHR